MSQALRGLWFRRRRVAVRGDSWGGVSRASDPGDRDCLAALFAQPAVSAAVGVAAPPEPLPAVPDKSKVYWYKTVIV